MQSPWLLLASNTDTSSQENYGHNIYRPEQTIKIGKYDHHNPLKQYCLGTTRKNTCGVSYRQKSVGGGDL